MKYIAYLADGSILQSDNFRVIYNAARYNARINGAAAIIFRANSEDEEIVFQHGTENKTYICGLWYGFHRLFVFRGADAIQSMAGLFYEVFSRDWCGRDLLSFIGLEV